MTFVAPGFLIAAAALGAVVVALHFLLTTHPRLIPLPTARFAPERPAAGRSRAFRLNDLLLLGVRVALVLVIGAALAGPVLPVHRRPLARILVVDRSRAVASAQEVADSARGMHKPGDALVLFDSRVKVVRDGARDSLAALRRTDQHGRLTPALVAALRLASEMQQRADSVEVTIISPLKDGELDAATDSVRALWPGAIRLVPVTAMTDTVPQNWSLLPDAPDDPLRLALPPGRGAETVRVARGGVNAADSDWAAHGHVLVEWPRGGAIAALPMPWMARTHRDTVGAVLASGVVVVAPFVRLASLTSGAAGTGALPPAATRVVARWADGEPAAIEHELGAGCVRTVALDVPSAGDLVLQPRFARLAAALTEPCGGAERGAPASRARLASLAGAGPQAVAASLLPSLVLVKTPLTPWLLAAALVLAALELLLRRRTAGAIAG